MDFDDQVNQLIEKSLRTARAVIEAGGTWGCNQRLTRGTQDYRRLPDGRVLFGVLLWGDQLA